MRPPEAKPPRSTRPRTGKMARKRSAKRKSRNIVEFFRNLESPVKMANGFVCAPAGRSYARLSPSVCPVRLAR